MAKILSSKGPKFQKPNGKSTFSGNKHIYTLCPNYLWCLKGVALTIKQDRWTYRLTDQSKIVYPSKLHCVGNNKCCYANLIITVWTTYFRHVIHIKILNMPKSMDLYVNKWRARIHRPLCTHCVLELTLMTSWHRVSAELSSSRSFRTCKLEFTVAASLLKEYFEKCHVVEHII